ncbi:MAG TPA: LysR family transcriptional regulator ArgP [Polyangia bacterium]|jgi:LysR family transcriptional regulator (chromosome initiation inhibitor)|nr:LysR family transcriptional regulator ArgP [Polyangia bacterium]
MYLHYDQLSALVAVVREGSFDRAARVLHLTPSAVSQRIKQLEENVGAIVVVRGTPCSATGVGETLYRHAQQVELLERDLLGAGTPVRAASSSRPSAPLTIAANADSLATWLIPGLARLTDRRELRVEIVVDDQDHTAEWLRSGRVLCAVTAEARPVAGCRAQALGVMRYRATASPAFVRRWFPAGATVEALRAAPVVMYNRKDELQEQFVRRVLRGRPGSLRPHFVPSPHAFIDATLLGVGWGMNPELLADEHLKTKKLVDVASGHWLDVPLYWQQWSLMSPTLESLASAMTAQAAVSLRPPSSAQRSRS